MDNYVIGIDFGTSSVRTIVVNASNGAELATSEFTYPRWSAGKYVDAAKNQFRQHPLDYIEGLEYTVNTVVSELNEDVVKNVKALSVDTTGSTPVAVNERGVPLALLPDFAENPNAMFVLWKDHTATREAAEINAHAKKFQTNYLKYVGGIYSSEWFWAKLLYVLRSDEEVRNATYSWVEHCDWIPFLLTGGEHVDHIKRSVCAAGHKGLWAAEFGGMPPNDFFTTLDPLLQGFRDRCTENVYSSDTAAGELSPHWAEKLSLPTGVRVGVGALDAHMGAVGGQIEPHYLSKVMGTSTCDMIVTSEEVVGDKCVDGICGQVNGSIIPGMIGMEAGQSAFGDVYAWFQELISWPIHYYLAKKTGPNKETSRALNEVSNSILTDLSEEASKIPVDASLELSLDWFNGRRTPDANQFLKGAISELNLGSDAPRVFRSLAEGTCFGAKKIVDRFIKEGVEVKGIIALGGVARKSPFIMQMMADILEMPIKVHRSEQTCALGASMFAATVAGIYENVEQAMSKMGQGFDLEYQPNQDHFEICRARYLMYKKFCDFIEENTNKKLDPWTVL